MHHEPRVIQFSPHRKVTLTSADLRPDVDPMKCALSVRGFRFDLLCIRTFSSAILQTILTLQFHLKRFQYDYFSGDLTKVNEPFEFPTELDMAPWLPGSAASTCHDGQDLSAAAPLPSGDANPDCKVMPSKYSLNAIVMHVGSPSVGHYYAYARTQAKRDLPSEGPTCNRAGDAGHRGSMRWVKLDDERVTEVSEEEVLRDAFGGDGMEQGLSGFGGQVCGLHLKNK